ncbi:hypothetical protein [Nocardia sp. NPDC056100]|uniref:hypothetical protein n=1 Tax=Nocardia sp. NPDC056100 TaxID=3345712 RepID=UPI0035D95ADF
MNSRVRGSWSRFVPAGYSLALSLLVLGPLLGPGYLLLRDAVSTPRSYLTDSALGLGDAAPRAVPQDALIATLSPLLDGGLIVKAILLTALWLAGWGAATLTRYLLHVSTGPQLVAATLAIWNPYVAERLLQGHWSLLTGYAALPWIALHATRLRTIPAPFARTWPVWAALGGWLAVAGLTPTGSLLAGIMAFLLVGRRNLLATVALWITSSAPWLAATVLAGSGAEPSDPAGVAAFAARAEPLLGTLGSLAGLGGIWNSTAVPGSRTTFFALIGTAILLALVATGIRSTLRPGATAPGTRQVLAGLALAAIVIPALGATGWGLSIGEFLVAHVPGAGLLRDTQKFAALTMPAFVLCAAGGCRAVAEWIARRGEVRRGHGPIGAVAAVFVVLVLISLPDMAWGVGGELRPVTYPAGWQRVASKVEGPGDVAVLPGGMFRKFRWSGGAPVLDPAPRMLPRDVLQTGELPVQGATVSGEGMRAGQVERLLLRGGSAAELARLGVGWVLVEGGTPGPVGESKITLGQLNSVYSDRDLQLYRVPGEITPHDASAAARRVSGAAHLVWGVLLCGGIISALVRFLSQSRTRRRSATRSAA